MTNHDPAYPTIPDIPASTHLSIREYFAAMAMQGFMTQDKGQICLNDRLGNVYVWRAEMVAMNAAYCVSMADALIAALNAKESFDVPT